MEAIKKLFVIWTLTITIASSKTIENYLTKNSYQNGSISRAYVPDAQFLDFVYHGHDEMTKFLR